MLVPPINAIGKFTFAEPFNTLLKTDQEYRVSAVRSLLELESSEEQPYKTVYVPVALTEIDFKEDLDKDVPIVVLVSSGNEYVYVPADRILTIPNVTGVRYQEVILAVNLGLIPTALNLDTAMSIIKTDVYDTLGVRADVEKIPSSAVRLLTQPDSDVITSILNNRKTISKSYRTKYEETKTLLLARETLITELEAYIATLI